ncbi:P44/Msp2 family outer membrane protein [Anaplasma phagocytophilum]|uniref:Surface antigen family protein n=1 Tax=Anaplasma phagocytophilum str. NCH-1 TaxID=1359161 RepID=A0A0F3NJQ6_ANAPH|nr:hypothetical protein YYU_00145 [Anaplasma phagocytophilum str. HZ2]KJV60176.1 surface antigen family protein [Anaplasma phagocytophilum str. Webster]KJV68283.1 surface antigen family protein [Anaplasma phagocytophilum str. NCH-1]KJV86356.1 surface antigen family protein [Anaplasma phagocytophilum str. ApNYW]
MTNKNGDSGTRYAKYLEEAGTSSNAGTSLCGGKNLKTTDSNTGVEKGQVLHDFVSGTLSGGTKNWPTSSESTKENNDNAGKVAKDLTKLTPEEKTIVAGLLAKTIEGGEVVEIRAVSSTSVMVNACYDLLSEGLGVVPYACVGLGGNFVGGC